MCVRVYMCVARFRWLSGTHRQSSSELRLVVRIRLSLATQVRSISDSSFTLGVLPFICLKNDLSKCASELHSPPSSYSLRGLQRKTGDKLCVQRSLTLSSSSHSHNNTHKGGFLSLASSKRCTQYLNY